MFIALKTALINFNHVREVRPIIFQEDETFGIKIEYSNGDIQTWKFANKEERDKIFNYFIFEIGLNDD